MMAALNNLAAPLQTFTEETSEEHPLVLPPFRSPAGAMCSCSSAELARCLFSLQLLLSASVWSAAAYQDLPVSAAAKQEELLTAASVVYRVSMHPEATTALPAACRGARAGGWPWAGCKSRRSASLLAQSWLLSTRSSC
jgi:hypothetical protein